MTFHSVFFVFHINFRGKSDKVLFSTNDVIIDDKIIKHNHKFDKIADFSKIVM